MLPVPPDSGLLAVRRSVSVRSLLSSGELLSAPGCFDALSARLAQASGFSAVYMTGFGASAAVLGRPDVGLMSAAEMTDAARRICDAVTIPVIADADTGYGNALNVVRTVRDYERAGVSAIQLEDQVSPKRCGHMSGKAVIDAAEATAKIAAAVAARELAETVIIARTDARATDGLDAAIERGKRFRDVGADVVFIEALTSEAEFETVATVFHGTPLMYNWVDGGKSPMLSRERISEMGYSILIFPVSALLAAATAMARAYATIADEGTPQSLQDRTASFEEFTTFIGLDDVRAVEARFV